MLDKVLKMFYVSWPIAFIFLKGWLTVFFFFFRLDCVYGVQSNMC